MRATAFLAMVLSVLLLVTTGGATDAQMARRWGCANGLVPGDTLEAVFSDATGLFDLVITGQLLPDLDGDGQVSLADVQMVASAWHTVNLAYDFDGDGAVTVVDIETVATMLE